MTTTAIDLLATILLERDDWTADLHTMRPALQPDAWDSLCAALEVCEVHICDAAICRDDQDRTCPTGYDAATCDANTTRGLCGRPLDGRGYCGHERSHL